METTPKGFSITKPDRRILGDEGDSGHIELNWSNQIMWYKNEHQATHQVTMKRKYTNRYDITVSINGLPLAQMKLKRGSRK